MRSLPFGPLLGNTIRSRCYQEHSLFSMHLHFWGQSLLPPLLSFWARHRKIFDGLTLSQPSDLLKIKTYQGGHLRGLPVCFFGFFRPPEWKMPDLPGFLCLFKNGQGLEKNLPLPFLVSHLPHEPPVRVFNGGRPGYSN